MIFEWRQGDTITKYQDHYFFRFRLRTFHLVSRASDSRRRGGAVLQNPVLERESPVNLQNPTAEYEYEPYRTLAKALL